MVSNPAFVPVAAFTNTGLEVEQYYFHPDHLGSSNYITNIAGEVSQHTEYFAFGETFVEEHKGSNNSPYKFNGKELDNESGLYYYGARYYDPRISIWASVDKPLLDGKYMSFEHDGGVKNSFNLSSYAYCRLSPITMFDPDGNQYNNSVLLTPEKSMKYVAHHFRGATEYEVKYNNFTQSTAHLLSLVSGINEKTLRNAKIIFRYTPIGGGGLTEGSSSKNSNINVFWNDPTTGSISSTDANGWKEGFLKLMSHEVGHILQIDKAGSNEKHLIGSIKEYVKNFLTPGEDTHDGKYATKEKEADIGEKTFASFRDFVDVYYGGKIGSKMLDTVLSNKSNSEKDKIAMIDRWWKQYQKSK